MKNNIIKLFDTVDLIRLCYKPKLNTELLNLIQKELATRYSNIVKAWLQQCYYYDTIETMTGLSTYNLNRLKRIYNETI